MEELNIMLADLADDGALDSAGVFTLSLDRAGEKLAAYRLANPGLFVLNLVASAVSAGATRFTVETHETETSFTFDPRLSYPDQDLQRLFSSILEPGAPAHLRELALALHGARALPDQPAISFSLAISDSPSRELVVEGQEIVLRPGPSVPSGSGRGACFRLMYQRRGAWTRLFNREGSSSVDVLQHLYHFCRYAPLSISNNGQPKSSRVALGVYDSSIFAWRHLQGRQPMNELRLKRCDLLVSAKVDSPVASSMIVALGTAKAAQAEGLLLISRGVTFRRTNEPLGFPLACAVVTADHLEKNLSQSDLVENADYLALLEALRAEVDELVLEVCAGPPVWSTAVAVTFAGHLDRRFPLGRPAPLVVEAFRQLRKVEEACRSRQGQSEQMEFWRKLTHLDRVQARTFGRELSQAVRRHARQRLAAGQWPEALELLLDLAELKDRRPDALRVAVLVLADKPQEARALLTPELDGYSQALAYLLGSLDQLEGDEPMVRFLRFQRAVDSGQWETADLLAEGLKTCDGTAILFLWLGWFALSRKRYGEGAQLWNRALRQVKQDERGRWAEILWPELAGKVSFLDQVRWEVRRGLDEVLKEIRPDRRGAYRSSGQMHPARWARLVWKARIREEAAETRDLFVKGYLAALIDSEGLRLEPLTSSELSLSPFYT